MRQLYRGRDLPVCISDLPVKLAARARLSTPVHLHLVSGLPGLLADFILHYLRARMVPRHARR